MDAEAVRTLAATLAFADRATLGIFVVAVSGLALTDISAPAVTPVPGKDTVSSSGLTEMDASAETLADGRDAVAARTLAETAALAETAGAWMLAVRLSADGVASVSAPASGKVNVPSLRSSVLRVPSGRGRLPVL